MWAKSMDDSGGHAREAADETNSRLALIQTELAELRDKNAALQAALDAQSAAHHAALEALAAKVAGLGGGVP